MKNFNTFAPLLMDAQRLGRNLYVLGKRGDENTLYNDVNNYKGDKQRTIGEVLIYDYSSGSLDWKSIYMNSKGHFIKKNGTFYLKK